jgi:type I restriction enzyme S subunit
MSRQLPRGWATASLSDLGRWLGGGTPSKSVREYWENGTFPWVSPKDMKRLRIDSSQDQITAKAVAESATNLVPAQSVLMVTRSGILEHSFPVAINTVPVTINQDLKAWTPYGGIDPLYAAYFLKAKAQKVLDDCSKDGTTVSSIDFDRLSDFEMPVAPTAEQKRIVLKIDELFSEIEEGERALERVQKLVERYRQSVLKAAVTGELTRDWRERHNGDLESGEALRSRILKARRAAWEMAELNKMKANGATPANDQWRQKYLEPSEPVIDYLGKVPNEWQRVRVDAVGEVQLGRQRSPAHHVGEFMRPYLRVANVFEERIDISDVMSMNFTPDEFLTYALRSGDILLNEGQSKELVGRPAIYRDEMPGVCFTNTLVRFRATEVVLPEFALIVFLHYMKSGYFQKIARITTNIAHLGAGRFAGMSFPVPSSDEQREIVDRLERQSSVYDRFMDDILEQDRQVASLRQSVLKAAFSGSLVLQDHGDEPANVLLQRIAAEHSEAATRTRRGRKKKEEAA